MRRGESGAGPGPEEREPADAGGALRATTPDGLTKVGRGLLAGLAIAGLAAVVLIVMVTPSGRQATAEEWLVQVAVIVAAGLLLVVRATGKR